MRRCPDTFEEFAILTGVLPSKDFETRGAILRIAKPNRILKRPVNKLFSIEIYIKTLIKQISQETKSSGKSSCNW